MRKRKAFFQTMIFSVLVCFGVTACGGGGNQNSANQEKITVSVANGGSNNLILGQTVQLEASIKGVTWESSKPEIATVDNNGLVTSLAVGSTAISASKKGYNPGKITIKVDLETIQLTIPENKTTLVMDETIQLQANKDGVTWSSSDESIATVNNGLVTAVYAGEVTISAAKDGFNAGKATFTVNRPEATKVLHFEDADHYSADGWWELPSAGGMMGFAMQTVNGWNPIAQANSWGQTVENPETFVGGFGVGDKETIKFNANKAGKAEVVVNIGNSDETVLADMMDIKLNGTALNLANVTLEAHAGDWGNSLEFGDLSLGELDIVSGENTLVFEMKAENSLFLNEVAVYGEMTITLVQPAAKEQIAVKAETLEVIVDETVAIESDVTGLSYASVDETIATVNDSGVVTGVKVGKTNITVKKDGMYSVRVEITVNPKPVAGQIIIEAEDGEEVADGWGGSTYMRQADGSGMGMGGSSAVHSGGAYVTYFSMGGGDVDLTLTIKFQATEAKTMVLSVVGSAPVNYMGGDAAPYVFAESAEISVNETAVTFTDQQFPAPEGYSAEMVEIVIGDVAVVAGENTLVFHTTGVAPSIDCFKLSVKA